MHVFKLVLREGLGSFILGFEHRKQAEEARGELINPDATLPRVIVKDDFGRSLDIDRTLVGAVMIEDVDEATEMTVRMSLSQTIGQVDYQMRAENHPKLNDFQARQMAQQRLMNGVSNLGFGNMNQ